MIGFTVLLTLMVLPASTRPVTFDREIAPILFERCAPCHHEGGIGPFTLMSYQDARRHASQIAFVAARRYMPPWPPQPGYGDFKGDRRLSNDQIKLITEWVAGGGQEGDPPIGRPRSRNEWQMGRPDLVLRMPQAFRVPAEGKDTLRNFPSELKEIKFVKGFELRLNNTRGVHSAGAGRWRSGVERALE